MSILVGRWFGLPVPVWLALGALVICDLILVLPAHPVLQSWASVSLAILLPGMLLVNALLKPRARVQLMERFVLGVGAGFAVLVILMLVLSYLPGGLSFTQVLLSFNAVVLLLSVGNAYTLRSPLRFYPRTWREDRTLWPLVALLVGAAFLRFTHLGYSELHGDEALVALRATDVIQGWERGLFVHKKGPAEILIGTTMYLLAGGLTEFAAHLPFALASWTGVLAVYVLGRRWFGAVTGWWAGPMVAVDGYLMAFGRMLQYQSIVFLMVVLAVLAVELAHRRGEHVRRYLLLASLCMATGLLAHYEAVIAAVPVAVLLLGMWQREGGDVAAARRMASWLALPLLLGSALCTLFYVPFVLDPEFFRDTFAYIFGHRLAGQAAPEVFLTVVGRSTLYSSSYYFWT